VSPEQQPRRDDESLLRWPRLGYLIIGALIGAITMELMRQAGW
jgi:hypothetical protein